MSAKEGEVEGRGRDRITPKIKTKVMAEENKKGKREEIRVRNKQGRERQKAVI